MEQAFYWFFYKILVDLPPSVAVRYITLPALQTVCQKWRLLNKQNRNNWAFMPELPEVETTLRGIEPWIANQIIDRLFAVK